MDDIARDGRDLEVCSNHGDWRVGWYPPPDPPSGTPHGAAAVCVSGGRVVLVSGDGRQWGLPGGRPEPHERWVDTLRREVGEEACAVVEGARLLGFTRGECVRGPEAGLVLVRSMWRAEVRLRGWAPRFEIAHRRLVPAHEALASVVIADPEVGPIYRRLFAEAGFSTANQGGRATDEPTRATATPGYGAPGHPPRQRSSVDRDHRSRDAVALASRSLALTTVPPELTSLGTLEPQVASGPNSRKKS
jgi:ADP-ribose pyrophosphatase YjhB (NUDIX family)